MFRLPIFLIALLHKPQRSHRYACVCEAALSEKYSAPNIKVFSVDYTSRVDICLTGYALQDMPLTKIGVRLSRIGLFAKPIIQQMSHVHMVFFNFLW